MYDILVLGAGPAGISAVIYAARKKLKTAVVTENVGGQTLMSAEVENYLGYQFVAGPELVAKFEEHLNSFQIDQEYSKAKSIEKKNSAFVIRTENEKKFESKAVIIATGKTPRKLGIPGEDKFIGRGVTYCATCDGPLFSGMDVAVVGGGNSALEAAEQLTRIASIVYAISRSLWKADEVTQRKVKLAENVVTYIGYETVEIRGDAQVSELDVKEIETGKTETLKVKGVFVEVGSMPVTDFLSDLIVLNEFKEIKVNSFGETSTPGIFAAGDVTDVPEKQIIIAAGEGAKAALSAYKYLLSLKS